MGTCAEDYRPELAIRRLHAQHRHGAVRGASGVGAENHAALGEFPSVHDEARDSAAPRQARRAQFAQGLFAGSGDLRLHRLDIGFDLSARFRRSAGKQRTRHQRSRVRVRRVENDLLSPDSGGFLQPRADGLRALAGEAEQVRRDQQRPLPIAVLNRERLGE